MTVTGCFGVGKTSVLFHVAFQLEKDGYDLLLITNPENISEFFNPHKKTLFILDDFCGKHTLDITTLDRFKSHHKVIEDILKSGKAKILVSCRSQVYQDGRIKAITLFDSEKQAIAYSYLGTNAINHHAKLHNINCFPELCRLGKDNKLTEIEKFNETLISIYRREIEILPHVKAFGKYCVLALCFIFDNHLKEEYFIQDIDKDTKKVIKNIWNSVRWLEEHHDLY